jgi:hypothetical protein
MMYNRLTTIVIATIASLAAVASAAAAHHRGHHGSGRYYLYAPAGDSYCSDRAWGCGATPVQREISHAAHRTRIGHAHASRHGGLSVADLTSGLQGKVSEIISACGARLISGYRPGARVAGSGHASLHSTYPARAADLSGNPGCIYAHLHGWQGGYSTDYGSVRHVHISYSPPGSGYLAGREWHARFAHYGGGHHRYARRHHRFAMR